MIAIRKFFFMTRQAKICSSQSFLLCNPVQPGIAKQSRDN
jgi:hypothetical protein